MRLRHTYFVAIALGAACGDATGPAAVAGTYRLQTVGGSALPLAVALWTNTDIVDGELVFVDNTLELTSGALRLNSDATFDATHVYRTTAVSIDPTTGNTVNTSVSTDSLTDSGTFTVTGSSIQTTSSDGTVNTGSLSGDVLTVDLEGVAWVYRQ